MFNIGSASISIMEVPPGAAAPTVAQVLATPSYVIPAGQFAETGIRKGDIYSAASSAATGTFQELL
jgi:S1-C subfamily serine protease